MFCGQSRHLCFVDRTEKADLRDAWRKLELTGAQEKLIVLIDLHLGSSPRGTDTPMP